jgi:dolichol-phosphate mannosyltransferase
MTKKIHNSTKTETKRVQKNEMKYLVIIPTYNERDNIVNLIERIFKAQRNFHVLVVDDNSPDQTGKIVAELAEKDSRIHIIHRAGKMGLGTAYIEGFRYALANGAEYIFQMDADHSHDPKFLEDMLVAIKECDLVLGSRYINGVRVSNWPFRRLLLSKLANLYVQFIAKLPFEDSTGGFKCFRRRVLEAFDLDIIRSDGYSFQIEMTYWAFKLGFRIKEIPIVFLERVGGFSKMSHHIVLEAIWMVLRLRLKIGL